MNIKKLITEQNLMKLEAGEVTGNVIQEKDIEKLNREANQILQDQDFDVGPVSLKAMKEIEDDSMSDQLNRIHQTTDIPRPSDE